MYVLAMETTGGLSSVALTDGDGRSLGTLATGETMSHLQRLIPMTEELLSSAGVQKNRLTQVAVSAGPGSFTGVRIGVSTARALCQTLEIPAVAVPTLDAFLYKPEAVEAAEAGVVPCAIIYARRGQVYGIIKEHMPGCACMLDDVLAVIREKIFPQGRSVLFFGDGIDHYEEKINSGLGGRGDYSFAEKPARYQDAVSVSRLALEMIERGETVSFDGLFPDYMRKAEAEQKLLAGELKTAGRR